MNQNNINKNMMLNTFYEANEFIDLVESKFYDKDNDISKLPLAINCIFACELYLKILLLNNGYNIDLLKKVGHNLRELFSKLPIRKQNHINEWMVCFERQNIFELLDNIKNDFVNLRYMYLDNNYKKFDLYIIAQFTYKLQYEASMELLGYDIKENKRY